MLSWIEVKAQKIGKNMFAVFFARIAFFKV
jgi:hypothetical protein